VLLFGIPFALTNRYPAIPTLSPRLSLAQQGEETRGKGAVSV